MSEIISFKSINLVTLLVGGNTSYVKQYNITLLVEGNTDHVI